MALRSGNFMQTFLEAGVPTWLLLIALMVLGRSQVGGIVVLVILFAGVYGALRLRNPDSEGARRLAYYVGFCLAQGAAIFAVMFGTAIVLSGLGLSSGRSNSGLELVAYGFAFVVSPLVPFGLVRGIPAIPDAVRAWGPRGITMRLGGLVLGAIAFSLAYFVYSEPYIGSAHSLDPLVKSAAMFDNMDGPDQVWDVSDPSVQLAYSGGSLHLTYSQLPTWFYTLSRAVQPGSLPVSDGFRMSARSNAATSLFIELEETGGGVYRTWADLPAGEWTSLIFGEPIPFLQTADTNDQLDWKDINRITFAVYVEAPGTELWLDNLEIAKFDHANEYVWFARKTEHLNIRFHPSESSVIDTVAQAGESQFERLVQVLGYRPYGRIPITIVSSHAELEQRQRASKPTWQIANAFPDWLDILTPRLYSPWFNNHSPSDINGLIPHEVVHLLIGHIVGYPGVRQMPAWLNEGLATYLGGQNSDEQTVRKMASEGTLPTLDQLNKAFSGQGPIGNSYAVARSLIAYMVDTYGDARVAPLLNALGGSSDFNAALVSTVGIDTATLERDWRQSLVGGY